MAVSLAAGFIAPATASAAVTCSLTAGALTVDVSGADTQGVGLRMENSGTEVGVYDNTGFSGTVVNCGTTPTQANTNSIVVTDVEPGITNRTVLNVSLSGGPFVNSDATGEGAGTKEIEITFNGGEESTDDLLLAGAPSPQGDNWRMGELAAGHGFQLDDTETDTVDVDDLVASGVEQLQTGLGGNPGNDILDARGGTGFTAPLNLNSVAQLVGGDGNDQIYGGEGFGWRLEGDEGADTMIGGSGNDFIQLAFGTDADTGDGNGGIDNCAYLNHGTSVHVDLRITTPQDTGSAGIDTLSDCESTGGGSASDVLIGTSGPNIINGGENTVGQTGADTLIGLGGNDVLDGSLGIDTVSYAEGSTGPITVSLATAAAQDTGGAGTDTIAAVENITGSQFSDTLTGNAGPNSIDAYDGILDTVDCGGDTDTAVSDELGVDALTNCETIDFSPSLTVGIPPADGALLNDATPTYALSSDEAAGFELSVDGGGFNSCAASCEVPALSDGLHTLEFRAVDSDENLHPGLNTVTRDVAIDTAPPNTLLKKPKVTGHRVKLRFSATEPGATFRCKIDKRKLRPCSSPKIYRNLSARKHTFTVVAKDAAGNTDPTPARRSFRIR